MTLLDERPAASPSTPPASDPAPASGRTPGRVATLAARAWRGRPEDPAWARPALLALLVGTAVLCVWNLSVSGWANAYYSAAAQAGSQSWSAMFFGSFDAAGAITVDKTPLSLWPMAISVRLFGLSSWSILLPQAVMGVATVGVLVVTVRRWFGAAAGLLAGLVLALTPVAALMFRYNNPDALLTLLMTIAAYTALRAIEAGRLRWYLLTGALIGFGFLTKQLQVLLVVPPFAFAALWAGRESFGRRIAHLAAAGVSMVVAAGWWLATVELWPADARPYIGGSQSNSIVELTLGYNGFGRLTGNEVGSVGGGGGPGGAGGPGGGGGGGWGVTGLTRMFDDSVGGQIAWLLPAALALLVLGLWITRRAARTDPGRASLLVWGGWLVVTGLTFSLMSGIFHEYYTVALAPAVGALVGIGAVLLWRNRHRNWAVVAMAAITMGTAVWSGILLDRAGDWNPWLGTVVAAGGLLAVAGFALSRAPLPGITAAVSSRLLVAAATVGIVVGLLGPTAWTLEPVTAGHQGGIVTAGPTVAGAGGPGGPRNGPAGVELGAGPGAGGLLHASEVGEELLALLTTDAESYTWVAAATGSMNASGYQLASEEPVMSIGGFNGSDPSPTLEQFQQYVADGEIHLYLANGLSGMRSRGGSDVAAEIAAWVASTFTATQVDGVTVYDLTQGATP